MKYLLIALTLLITFNVSAQKDKKNKPSYIRVFDLEGKKIAKGKILQITENSIILKNKPGAIIPINNIGYIKTKRSNSHNTIVGTSVGGGIGLIAILSSGNSSSGGLASAGKGIAIVGAIVITAVGAGVGYLTTLFKKSETYIINGDLTKWGDFKTTMEI